MYKPQQYSKCVLLFVCDVGTLLRYQIPLEIVETRYKVKYQKGNCHKIKHFSLSLSLSLSLSQKKKKKKKTNKQTTHGSAMFEGWTTMVVCVIYHFFEMF